MMGLHKNTLEEAFQERSMRKNICVLDTCSLLDLIQVELQGQMAIFWLPLFFELKIHDVVYREVDDNLKNREATSGMKDAFQQLHANNQIRINSTDKDCSEIVRSEIVKFGLRPGQKVDPGEQKSFELALELSRQNRDFCIFMVTGDEKILDILNFMSRKQFVGTIFTTMDILLYMYARNPQTFNHLELSRAMEELLQISRPKGRAPPTVQLFSRDQYTKILDDICPRSCRSRICFESS